MSLEDYRKMLNFCFRCGYCREAISEKLGVYKVCPEYEALRWDHHTCRGHVAVARAVLDGKLKYTPELVKNVYSCFLCRNCYEICPLEEQKIDIFKPIEAMRKEIYEGKYGLPEGVEKIVEALKETRNTFGRPQYERTEWVSGDIDVAKKADTLYLPGCITEYIVPEVARSVAKILNHSGVPFVTLGEEEWCCGRPAIMAGAVSEGRALAEHNIDMFNKRGIKRVITSCPLCYRTIKEEYPSLSGNYQFEVVHTTQLFSELMVQGKIRPKQRIGSKVTYHDPCELSRYLRILEPPREIIKSIPGINFTEMQRHGKFSFCCGAGGLVKASEADLALKVARMRISEAFDIGAEIVTTACPSCKWSLSSAAELEGAAIKVMDISEIVARSLGIDSET